jgi:hypothetical protein
MLCASLEFDAILLVQYEAGAIVVIVVFDFHYRFHPKSRFEPE